jgi:hypothetical protein
MQVHGDEHELKMFATATAKFQLHGDGNDHVKALVADIDDPYYEADPVDVDTIRMKRFHKQEIVRQNVEYRVPPPIDKKSLKHRYSTLSQKKMKAIKETKKQSLSKNGKIKIVNHYEDLEKELKEMEDEMNERDERIAKQKELTLTTMNDDNNNYHHPMNINVNMNINNKYDSEDEYIRGDNDGPQPMEFDEYFDLYGSGSSNNSEASSPYMRTTRQSIGGGGGDTNFDTKMKMKTKNNGNGKITGGGLTLETYHDKHGKLGMAQLMSPTPINNSSNMYIKNELKRRQQNKIELYSSILDEAALLQKKFITCVNEANLFSKELNKGNLYKIVERDPIEDQAWNALLDSAGNGSNNNQSGTRMETGTGGNVVTKLRSKVERLIPKGTGQRIAKMLVEVSNPTRDVRYLGNEHFFREHGRLQHEIQKVVAVKHMQPRTHGEIQFDNFNADAGNSNINDNNGRGISGSPKRNPKKRGGSPKRPHTAPATQTKSFAETMKEKEKGIMSSSAEGGFNKNDAGAGKDGMKRPQDVLEGRKEIMNNLHNILLLIVERTRNIQSQIDFIHNSGWNWMMSPVHATQSDRNGQL